MTDQPAADLLTVALSMADAGLAVIPIKADGTKAPAVRWKTYQDTAPNSAELQRWFGRPAAAGSYQGLGIVTGYSNVEMLEVEGRAADLADQLGERLTDSGLGPLWARLITGWMELSPSGGFHWLFRVDGPARPNTKLACRPGDKPNTVDVLIETRGAGGFVVTAPSNGRTHPTGQAWELLAGGPSEIPTLTVEERDALYLACTTFDQMPIDPPRAVMAQRTSSHGGPRPGDDYNAKVSIEQLLLDHGWTRGRRVGANTGWTRPGKDKSDGISATTSEGGGLWVFTTSTEFDIERRYDAFGAYAVLEHHGDLAEAARALRKAGYGGPLEQSRVVADQAAARVAELSGDDPTNISPTSGQAPVRINETTAYTLTDDGNALRLIDANAHQLRYCPQRGQWLTWDGHRWRWDEAEHVNELARGIARSLPTGGRAEDAHHARSLSARGVLAMIRLARSDPRAVVNVAQLDAQPYELNTPGGVVDLRTGLLLQPTPTALHTRATRCTPDPTYSPGDAPRWEKFLADTFAGDPDLTTYVQRILGQALIGVVLEQMLPFAHGSGANGKTTMLGVVQRLVGIGDDGYSISAPADLLLATANPGHPTEIARLAGARLVVTSELEDGQRFAEAKVKMLTGRDTITGRFMRQDWFSFTPTHTLFLLANHQPEVRAGGEAFWRRIALLPFLHTVPPEDRNPHLEDDLVQQEGPQILAWLVAGAATYLRAGIVRPASVEAATTSYATAQDTVGRFVNDCCDTAAPGTQTYAVASGALRLAYETWCRQEGETPVSPKALTTTLTGRFGVVPNRTRNVRMLDGIRLQDQLDNASPDGDRDRPLWNG